MIGYLVRPVVGVFVCSLGSSRRIAWALVDLEPSTVATSGVERCIFGGQDGPIQRVPVLKIFLERSLS